MSFRLAGLVTLALMCSACGVLIDSPSACDPEIPSCNEVWVTVTGPENWLQPEDYVLEISAQGWPVDEGAGGGVVAVQLERGQRVLVRLVRPRDCVAIAEFAALPGSNWVIRFAADGTTSVEDWTGRGHEMGPGLVEGQRTDCPSDI